MEIKIIDDSQLSQWEQYVNQHPGSIAWQSMAWSDLLKKHYPSTFYPIVAQDDSGIRGILPLYYIKTRLNKGALISVPYAVAGGIVADDAEASTLLLNEAIRLAGQHDACRITLKQYKTKIEGDLLTDANYYNKELSLTTDLDALRGGFDDTNKRVLDDAENTTFDLEYPSTDIKGFFKVLIRHHHRRGVPCVSQRWITDLVDCGMYSIALLKQDGKIVGGTMVKEFKTTVSFPFSCVNGANREDDVPYVLYWKLLSHFALKGMEIFHSGRIPRTNQADAYRLGWGGQEHGYFYQFHPNTGAKTEFSRKRGKKRQIVETCWKRLPQSAVKILGPQIVKEFP